MSYLYENLTDKIIYCAIEVHKNLGPGLMESSYERCLMYELLAMDFAVRRQVELPLIYKGIRMEVGYKIDLLVENKVILELKTIDRYAPIHTAQIMTYLKLTGCQLGLLMNFNVKYMKDGIKRVIL